MRIHIELLAKIRLVRTVVGLTKDGSNPVDSDDQFTLDQV